MVPIISNAFVFTDYCSFKYPQLGNSLSDNKCLNITYKITLFSSFTLYKIKASVKISNDVIYSEREKRGAR